MKASDILLSLKSHDLSVSKISNGKVAVRYENAEISDGIFLVSTYGSGEDFESACEDYLSQIRGKKLVFDAYGRKREEIKVLG